MSSPRLAPAYNAVMRSPTPSRRVHLFAIVASALGVGMVLGCGARVAPVTQDNPSTAPLSAAPPVAAERGAQPPPPALTLATSGGGGGAAEGELAAIAADPLAYLRSVGTRTTALDAYTTTFTRQERRGLLRALHPPEQIAVWFRRAPFSVRMKWLDPDIKYGESTYVQGQRGDRVRFVPRFGLFGMPPGLIEVDLQTPVFWGECRDPLTEFGLERLMARTLESIEQSAGQARITYLGTRDWRPEGVPEVAPRRVHVFDLAYPPSLFTALLQELYVDAHSDLPYATVIRRDAATIEALYVFDALDVQVQLRDEDFVLPQERSAREPPATLPPLRS